MKLLTTILLICSVNFAQAQSTLTGANTNPQAGESFITYSQENGPFPTEGNSGANVTWDFHTLAYDYTDTLTFVTCASTPECNHFSGSNLAASNGTGGYAYFTTNTSGFYDVGDYSDGDTTYYTATTEMLYPITYNTVNTPNFYAYENWVINAQQIYTYSKDTAICDGYGTLILPTGTFQNVLRIHHISHETDSEFNSGDPSANVSYYLENTYSWYMPGFHSTLLSIDYYTELDNMVTDTFATYSAQLPTAITTINNLETSIELYPNPTKDVLNVAFSISQKEAVSIIILDMTGRQVATIGNDVYNAGNHQLSYNTTLLSKGLYMVRLTSDTGSIIRKIEVL